MAGDEQAGKRYNLALTLPRFADLVRKVSFVSLSLDVIALR